MITKEQYQRIKKHLKSKYDEKEFMSLLWSIDCPSMLEELTPQQWKKMDKQNYLRIVKLYPSYIKENDWMFTPGHRLMVLLNKNFYNTNYEEISDIKGITTEDIIAIGKGFGLRDICEVLNRMPRKITADDIKAIAQESMWSVLKEIPTTKKCSHALFDKSLREEIARYERNELGKRTSLYMYMTKLTPEEAQEIIDEPYLGERIDITADNIKPKEMFGLLSKGRISANSCARQLEHAYLYHALQYHMSYKTVAPEFYDVRGKTQEDIELVEKLNNYLLMVDAQTMMEKQEYIREWMKQTLPELVKE